MLLNYIYKIDNPIFGGKLAGGRIYQLGRGITHRIRADHRPINCPALQPFSHIIIILRIMDHKKGVQIYLFTSRTYCGLNSYIVTDTFFSNRNIIFKLFLNAWTEMVRHFFPKLKMYEYFCDRFAKAKWNNLMACSSPIKSCYMASFSLIKSCYMASFSLIESGYS